MHVAVDFECYYDKKEYSIKTMGAYSYIHDPRFECYLVTIYSPEYKYSGDPMGADWNRIKKDLWVSHNMSFDGLVARRLGIPLPDKWYCTSDLSGFLHSPRSLEDAGYQLLGKELDKGYREIANGKHWPHDFTNEEQDVIIKAGWQDAENCWELWAKFSHLWPETEREISALTAKMGWRGVNINRDMLKENMGILETVRWSASQKVPWYQEEDVVWSLKQLRLKCAEEDIWCPNSLAEESWERIRWEKEFGTKYEWVSAMRNWMKANFMYRKLEKIRDRLTPEGRFPYNLFYFGAHTGRFAGAGGFNTQNMNNNPVIVDTKNQTIVWPDDNLYEVYERVEHFHPVYLRHHFIPSDGNQFIVCDLSQIEPRVAARLAGDEEFLDFIRSGLDPYAAHARTMGWKGDKLEGAERKPYKAQSLGLGYGCGEVKYMVVAEALAGLKLNRMEARKHVRAFRKTRTKIVEQWNDLDSDLWTSLRKNEPFKVTLPNGRKLTYWNLRRHLAKWPNGQPKKEIRGNVIRGWKPVVLYGAKIWENIVQGVSRDIFGEHLLEVEKIGPAVIQAHDEVCLDVPMDVKVSDVEEIMSVCPSWLPNTPVASEGFSTQFYTKG